MEPERRPLVLTQEELWLLQSVIRHEIPQHESWRNPPGSQSLNDEVARALLRCADGGLLEAAVLVSLADTYALDACVPQTAKSPAGSMIGRTLLLKSFRVRVALQGEEDVIATALVDPQEEASAQNRLREWQAQQSEE